MYEAFESLEVYRIVLHIQNYHNNHPKLTVMYLTRFVCDILTTPMSCYASS